MKRQRGDLRVLPRLPIVALLDALPEGMLAKDIQRLLDINHGTLYRWRRDNFMATIYTCDELAVRAGLHPAEVWGDDWWIIGVAG